MTKTDEQRQAAQTEADRLYPPNHTVDDPFGETGEAQSDQYGYDETANRAFVAGAEWRVTKAVQSAQPSIAVIAEAIRNHCTAPSELVYPTVHVDALIRFVADWIENPPEWVGAFKATGKGGSHE